MITKRNIFKEKRIEKGMSLKELSNNLNTNVFELKLVESFDKTPNLKYLKQMKEVLCINDEEMKEYFNDYYEMKSSESKAIKNTVSLCFAAFAFSLFFMVILYAKGALNGNYYKTLVLGLIGFSFLVGSFASFVFSKNKISNFKFIIYLIVLIVLFILCLVIYYKCYDLVYRVLNLK